MPETTLSVPIERIEALSGVDDPVRLERLCKSMRAKSGWVGRPLLVVEDACRFLALTGSHRHAAAKQAALAAIPCIVIDAARWQESKLDYQTVRRLSDERRIEELERAGLVDAAVHIRLEMAANARDRQREAVGDFDY